MSKTTLLKKKTQGQKEFPAHGWTPRAHEIYEDSDGAGSFLYRLIDRCGPSAFVVWDVVCHRADREDVDVAGYSHAELVADTGLSRRTVRRALARLVKFGYLSGSPRSGIEKTVYRVSGTVADWIPGGGQSDHSNVVNLAIGGGHNGHTVKKDLKTSPITKQAPPVPPSRGAKTTGVKRGRGKRRWKGATEQAVLVMEWAEDQGIDRPRRLSDQEWSRRILGIYNESHKRKIQWGDL